MELQQNIALAPLTTLRIGGPARWFVRAENEADVLEADAAAREELACPLFWSPTTAFPALCCT